MAIGNNRRRTRRMKNEMNVVPYIDVMLVLLVIFMITAPMISPGLVNLPSVGRASEVKQTPIEIQLTNNNQISIRKREPGADFESVELNDLVAKVRALTSNSSNTDNEEQTPIVVAADGKVSYEEVMKIVDQLNSNGITKLALLVNQKSTKK